MAQRLSELLGSIVAFEGCPDTISTQLRLLPTSSQVLILPSIQCYLADEDAEQEFDARCYIWQVHDAFVARSEAAQAFLQGSTPTNKRLVFMNGGTPSAQALCVRTIMKRETAGNKVEAESIFDELVKEGLTGLERHLKQRQKGSPFVYNPNEEESDGEFDDPITRAMRAADALDRQTASLQPPDSLDVAASRRKRSSSLPLYGYSDEFGDAAPFFVFGARRNSQLDDAAIQSAISPSTTTPTLSPYEEAPEGSVDNLNQPPAPCSPSCIGETYKVRQEKETVTEASNRAVGEKEAFKVNSVTHENAPATYLKSSSCPASLIRVRSLDRIFPSNSKFRDLGIPTESWLAGPKLLKSHRPLSVMVITDEQGAILRRFSPAERPQTVTQKPNVPVLEVSVALPGSDDALEQPCGHANYIDRGTMPDSDLEKKATNQPVFSGLEHLIVYLKEKAPDIVLEHAINAQRDGRYWLFSQVTPTLEIKATTDEKVADSGFPGTPVSRSSRDEDGKSSASRAEEDSPPSSTSSDDYDPFAYSQSTRQSPVAKYVAPKVSIVRPPTPAQTPPPSIAGVDSEQKFHEFKIAPNQTPVAVQNSLRSILGGYFPPDTQGYHQFQFSMLPELDGLWKPVFRAPEDGGPQIGEGKVHQILAIGSQEGVKKEYSLAITGRLEKLGSKSSVLGRADRLDFRYVRRSMTRNRSLMYNTSLRLQDSPLTSPRYLLANAMQTFTAQPLANQTSDNPFTNSYLLATLLVPHLETYLVLHSEVRYLLLQYPPEHFRTVLALQKLVGVDFMKVAQIVDASSKEHLPFTHIRGASIGSKSESSPNRRISPALKSPPDVSVSKANFLLTSTASDKDIATFVSTVWNISADSSDLGTPEPSIGGSWNAKPRSSPSAPGSDGYFPSTIHGRQSHTTTGHPQSRATTSTRSESITETVHTMKSIRSMRSGGKSRRKVTPPTDTLSIAASDLCDDSDIDVDARMLLPMFLKRSLVRKPNSRKALKFLGLA